MSLQHNAIDLLDHVSQALKALAEDEVHPVHCRFAASLLGAAADRLRVEPCRVQDIRAAFDTMAKAKTAMEHLKAGDHAPVVRGWVDSACYTYNAIIDLLAAMEAFHKRVTLDQAVSARPMGSRLRRLLPQGWGGDRV